MKAFVVFVAAAGLLALGSAAAENKPGAEQRFLMQMNSAPVLCSKAAGLARRSGYSGEIQRTTECIDKELAAGRTRYETMMRRSGRKTARAALKDMYEAWEAYMNSIDPFDPPDRSAEIRYVDAAKRWKLEAGFK
jgi:hypothetical protein